MKTRVCRLYGQGDIRIEEADVAAPGPGEVLVAMAAGGICGSDLHYYQDGGFGPIRVREPIVLGHEVAGTVRAVGAGVEGVAPGDRVAVNPSRPCNACRYCLDGLQQHCLAMRFFGSALRFPHEQGGFRDLMVVDAFQCVRVDNPEVSLAEAACAEPLAVCLHALNRAGASAGNTFLENGDDLVERHDADDGRPADVLEDQAEIADKPRGLDFLAGDADMQLLRQAGRANRGAAGDEGASDLAIRTVLLGHVSIRVDDLKDGRRAEQRRQEFRAGHAGARHGVHHRLGADSSPSFGHAGKDDVLAERAMSDHDPAADAFRALAVGIQHKGIGNDVGQCMHRIRDQALRMGNEADHQLHRRQQHIDDHADPGDPLTVGKALAGVDDVVAIQQIVGFALHGGKLYFEPLHFSLRT